MGFRGHRAIVTLLSRRAAHAVFLTATAATATATPAARPAAFLGLTAFRTGATALWGRGAASGFRSWCMGMRGAIRTRARGAFAAFRTWARGALATFRPRAATMPLTMTATRSATIVAAMVAAMVPLRLRWAGRRWRGRRFFRRFRGLCFREQAAEEALEEATAFGRLL